MRIEGPLFDTPKLRRDTDGYVIDPLRRAKIGVAAEASKLIGVR